jgi:nucleotide-binding universal stress UspA family protein
MNLEQLLELFDLQRNFTRDELDQSYRDLVQVWHPDKYVNNPRLQQKAEEKLKEINSAYTLLKEFLSKLDLAFDNNSKRQGIANVGTRDIHHHYTRRQAGDIHPSNQIGYSDAVESSSIPLRSIFHPTDFSTASEVAFSHALKIAVMAKAMLSILHVAPPKADVDLAEFPVVRQTLERWGTLPAGSSQEDLSEKSGIFVEKVVAVHDDPASSIRQFLARHPMDLVVLATHRYREPVRWLRKSVAEPIARESDGVTLFIPQGVDGFISHRDGSVRLQRILIPIDHRPRPQLAIDAASTMARILGCSDCLFTLAYVGNPADMPMVDTPTQVGWTWERVTRQGDVVKEILELERERAPNLMVMTTQGRDGFLDALRGSTTERVLRGSRCPLLAIPALRGDVSGAWV